MQCSRGLLYRLLHSYRHLFQALGVLFVLLESLAPVPINECVICE